MEEDKAAAYYEELTRKGEGAAKFKQGLGFSSSSKSPNTASNPNSLSSFVRASSPGKSTGFEKKSQLENIQNKLKKKHNSDRDGRGRERDRDRGGERKRRSRSRERVRERERRRRSRSRSYSDGEKRYRRSRERRRSRGGRSLSPRDRRSSKRSRRNVQKERNDSVDYSRLIKGYEEMTAAEKVKAKMKLQISQTVEKDVAKGMGAGWERFEFNKDAPLDDEEEIEAAEDDSAVVKSMGQSFRFSAVEARRKEQINAAHDEAMFGAPRAQSLIQSNEKAAVEDDKAEDHNRKEINKAMFGSPTAQSPIQSDEEPVVVDDRLEDEPVVVDDRLEDDNRNDINKNGFDANLISEKVLSKQQGSWRDRARKLQNG